MTEAMAELKAALPEPVQEPVLLKCVTCGTVYADGVPPKVSEQDWNLLQETQAALRDAWSIMKKLKAVQDAARALVESDPDSAADTEGETFTAWCALVAAIDDADTLLCEFGESHE